MGTHFRGKGRGNGAAPGTWNMLVCGTLMERGGGGGIGGSGGGLSGEWARTVHPLGAQKVDVQIRSGWVCFASPT